MQVNGVAPGSIATDATAKFGEDITKGMMAVDPLGSISISFELFVR